MIEPSDAEQAEWSETTRAYVRGLLDQIAEVERERDAAQEALDANWVTHQRVVAAEARAKALSEALTPFAFYGEPGDPDDVQHAWEIRHRDRFQDWIDFADIEAARRAIENSLQPGATSVDKQSVT